MTAINPYLNFDGNCEEAFNFYREVIGGEFTYMGRFGEVPADADFPPIPESEANKIMHVSLPIGDNTILMGSDISSAFGQTGVKTGDNISLSLSPDSNEESDRLFAGLSEGGTVVMPMSETFWGAYFGMLVDKFGIHWMINCEINCEGP